MLNFGKYIHNMRLNLQSNLIYYFMNIRFDSETFHSDCDNKGIY